LITQSVAHLYDGATQAALHAAAARTHAESTGIHRLRIYTELTELIAATLYYQDNASLKSLFVRAKILLAQALDDNLSDSIMRCELLLATLALQIFDGEEATAKGQYYATRGLHDSLRFGNGLFDWAFHNLLAVTWSPEGIMTDRARREFESCLEVLQDRGLTFVGAGDGCYPTIYAISNIVAAYLRYSESDASSVLSRIAMYNMDARAKTTFPQLFKEARRGKALFLAPHSARLKLRYPSSHGFFTPIF
jgi:hypothetical protein